MSDKSNFDEQDYRDVYGSFSDCFLCERPAVDPNHTLKRLAPRGESEDIMSSVLNLSSLCRICHSRGDIHTLEIEKELLIKSSEYVRNAIRAETYMMKSKDLAFRKRFKRLYTNGLQLSPPLP